MLFNGRTLRTYVVVVFFFFFFFFYAAGSGEGKNNNKPQKTTNESRKSPREHKHRASRSLTLCCSPLTAATPAAWKRPV